MRARLMVATSFLCAACSATTDASSNAKVYTGTYSVDVVESTVSTSLTGGGTFPCTNTYRMSGALTMSINSAASTGSSLGTAQIAGTQKEIAHSTANSCVAKGDLSTVWSPNLTGTTGDLRFASQNVVPNGSYVVTSKTSFAGALANGVVTGQLTFSVAGSGTIGTTSIVQSYATTTNVSLR